MERGYKDKPVKPVWKVNAAIAVVMVISFVFLLYGSATRSSNPASTSRETAVQDLNSGGTKPGFPEDRITVTHYKCYQSSEFAEICVYDLLCFDGDKVVIVSDKHKEWSPVEHHFQVGDIAAGAHTFDVYPRPPPRTQGLPVNTRLQAYYRHPSTLFDGLTPIDWVDGAMWIVEPEYRSWELQHIFFWAHSVFGLWEARVGNESWGNPMPPLDELWILKPRSIVLNKWNAASLDIITAGFNTKVNDLGDIGELSKEHLRCARRAGIPGEKSNVFSGIRSAVAFRKAAYDFLGLTVPEAPLRKLVIFNREGAGRAFENIQEMEVILKKYHVDYEIIKSHGSFEDQVSAMSRAGVLMMAHGAAATNTIFQAHRSVLIEVFPYRRKRFGFMQIAQAAGQFYFPIFAWDKPWTGDASTNSTEWERDCEQISSIQTNHIRTCDLAQKVARIRVPLDAFERTLVDAFDTIGYRIDLP